MWGLFQCKAVSAGACANGIQKNQSHPAGKVHFLQPKLCWQVVAEETGVNSIYGVYGWL